jgi:hypothetical protein
VKFKLDENLPVSAVSVLAAAGHDVDTVPGEQLAGRPDQDVVAASTAAQRVLISLDVGLGDIRAFPPGSRADHDAVEEQRAGGAGHVVAEHRESVVQRMSAAAIAEHTGHAGDHRGDKDNKPENDDHHAPECPEKEIRAWPMQSPEFGACRCLGPELCLLLYAFLTLPPSPSRRLQRPLSMAIAGSALTRPGLVSHRL